MIQNIFFIKMESNLHKKTLDLTSKNGKIKTAYIATTKLTSNYKLYNDTTWLVN